jgi:hypothetical protein
VTAATEPTEKPPSERWWNRAVPAWLAVTVVTVMGALFGWASLMLEFEQGIVLIAAVPTAIGAVGKVWIEAKSSATTSLLDRVGSFGPASCRGSALHRPVEGEHSLRDADYAASGRYIDSFRLAASSQPFGAAPNHKVVDDRYATTSRTTAAPSTGAQLPNRHSCHRAHVQPLMISVMSLDCRLSTAGLLRGGEVHPPGNRPIKTVLAFGAAFVVCTVG